MVMPTLELRLQMRERPRHGAPVMYEKWKNLLFLHWEDDPQEIQRTLPSGLYVDTFDGKAYLGVVAFLMRDVRSRLFSFSPGISDFEELNARTYVLFAYSKDNRLYAGRVWHNPHKLADVEVNNLDENVLCLNGFPKLSRDANHKIMSHGVEVDIFALEELYT